LQVKTNVAPSDTVNSTHQSILVAHDFEYLLTEIELDVSEHTYHSDIGIIKIHASRSLHPSVDSIKILGLMRLRSRHYVKLLTKETA